LIEEKNQNPVETRDLQKLRQKAEKSVQIRKDKAEALPLADKEQLIEELRIHQIELEMQNEELREIQQEIITARDQYRDLWENSPNGYLLLDRNGRIRDVNQSSQLLFEMTKSELLENRLSSLIRHRDQVALQLLLEKTWETGSSDILEISYERRDGSVCTCLLSCRTIFSQPDRIQAILTDISERRRLEKSLHEKDERLLLAVKAGHLGTWDRNLSTGELIWNNQLYELLGRDPKDPVSRGEDFFSYIHQDDVERVRRHAAEVLDHGTDFVDEFRAVREDGEIRWLAAMARVYRDSRGRPRRITGINYDITTQKNFANLLLENNKQLELLVSNRTAALVEANRLLNSRAHQLARLSSQLTLTEQRERRRLADMIHDNLQQYLVGARINMEVLSKKLTEEQQQSFQNAYLMIEKSMMIARSLTAELAPIILSKQGLPAALKWLTREMKEKYNLKLELNFDPEVNISNKDVSELLFQSVRELLMNVIKHAGTSSCRLIVSKDRQGRLQIEITDRGAGFDAEKISDYTEGFGLFSIRERVELMDGQLEIDSTPGTGTTVRLTAPVLAPDGRGRKKTESVVSDRSSNKSLERKIRVMIVDDHALLRQTLATMLDRHPDIEIIAMAADGLEAVRKAKEVKPNVILMDISMPRMDGIEATRIIHTENPSIRIIGLSMHDRPEQADMILDAGAAAFCSKSNSSDLLLAEILGREQGSDLTHGTNRA
jgi:PAS domain S-box-containing protein